MIDEPKPIRTEAFRPAFVMVDDPLTPDTFTEAHRQMLDDLIRRLSIPAHILHGETSFSSFPHYR